MAQADAARMAAATPERREASFIESISTEASSPLVPFGTSAEEGKVPSGTMQAKSKSPAAARILDAAYAVFAERGFAAATSLAIASRARVSKRTLYDQFGSKAGLLAALIAARAANMAAPFPPAARPRSRAALVAALRQFGAALLPGLTQPSTLTIMRMAIAEAEHAPELARLLDLHGRQPVANALRSLLQAAAEDGLIPASHVETTLASYLGTLQGGLILPLLLGLCPPPQAAEIAALAAAAARAAMAVASDLSPTTEAPSTEARSAQPRSAPTTDD